MTTKKVGGEYITIPLKASIQKWTVNFVFSGFQRMHLVSGIADNVVVVVQFFQLPTRNRKSLI